MIQDPPKPEKVSFYHGKTYVFEDPPYPEKVTKTTPKGSPNGTKMDPIAPQGPSKAPKKTNEKRTKNKPQKNETGKKNSLSK